MSWTRGKFNVEMGRAGWKSIGQGCFVNKITGKKFYAMTYEKRIEDKYDNGGLAWMEWAEHEETPPPF